jgi:hypothetical protein
MIIIQELNDTRFQRVLRAHNLKPFFPDQILQNFRAIPQLIHRGTNVCTHRSLNQVFLMASPAGLKQIFYTRANSIYDSAEIRRPAF